MQYFQYNTHKEKVKFLCKVTNNIQFWKICYSNLIFKIYGPVGCGAVYFRKLIAMFRRYLLPPCSGYSEIRGFTFPLKVCSNLVHQTSIPPKIIILLPEAVSVADFTVSFSLAGRICYISYFQPYLLCVFPFLLRNLEFQHLHHKNTSLCRILRHISPLHNSFL